MMSFAEILIALGPLQGIADEFGVTVQAVSNMKSRNSVSPSYWPALVRLAAQKGIGSVTIETLAALCSSPARPTSATSDGEKVECGPLAHHDTVDGGVS